ncbi:SDR family oxidoreductase [Streptomyces sp. NPDC057675]|uniref:SDR family oxidoreductase n=1 Tax=Streptomyces sp. NPDC057675 TaxID=3346204 RepID=UPI0036CE3FD9
MSTGTPRRRKAAPSPASPPGPRTVLITGAARGIGRACAAHLAEEGWRVYAGARRPADLEDLTRLYPDRIVPVLLDVTRSAHLDALTDVLPERLDALVNNAGIVADGPVEAVTPEAIRQVFEVNVIGATRTTQVVLDRLRRSGGRVVFVSSVSGRVNTPWTGVYGASKFALEGIADALRVELRPWRVPVVLVEPGPTTTDMWRGAGAMVDDTVHSMAPHLRELYEGHIAGIRRSVTTMQRYTAPVSAVVSTVERALVARRPKARYPVGLSNRALLAATALSSTALRDRFLAAFAGQPRSARGRSVGGPAGASGSGS